MHPVRNTPAHNVDHFSTWITLRCLAGGLTGGLRGPRRYCGRMADNKQRDTPVVLSRIYTRTGDDGTTALVDGNRVDKTDSRVGA